MSDILPDHDLFAMLTQKQCEVLDLLIEFKTSKEISRILDISPHTVDQRVDTARNRLGFSSRKELAQFYKDMCGQHANIPEQMTHQKSGMAKSFQPAHSSSRVGSEAFAPPGSPELSNIVVPVGEERDYHVGPEIFYGRWGTLARLATIFGLTAMLCIAFLGGLTIFVEVSSLVGR